MAAHILTSLLLWKPVEGLGFEDLVLAFVVYRHSPNKKA